MKFLADESIDRQIVDRLRIDGHFVWYIAEMKRGISDDAVLDMANRKKALLLTKVKIVSSTVNKHIKELTNAFTVITAGGIRIRQWFA